jgi:hypothetical protein
VWRRLIEDDIGKCGNPMRVKVISLIIGYCISFVGGYHSAVASTSSDPLLCLLESNKGNYIEHWLRRQFLHLGYDPGVRSAAPYRAWWDNSLFFDIEIKRPEKKERRVPVAVIETRDGVNRLAITVPWVEGPIAFRDLFYAVLLATDGPQPGVASLNYDPAKIVHSIEIEKWARVALENLAKLSGPKSPWLLELARETEEEVFSINFGPGNLCVKTSFYVQKIGSQIKISAVPAKGISRVNLDTAKKLLEEPTWIKLTEILPLGLSFEVTIAQKTLDARVARFLKQMGVEQTDVYEKTIREFLLRQTHNYVMRRWWSTKLITESKSPMLQRLSTKVRGDIRDPAFSIPVYSLADIGRLIGASPGAVQRKAEVVARFNEAYAASVNNVVTLPISENEFSITLWFNENVDITITLGWYPRAQVLKVAFDAQGKILSVNPEPMISVRVGPTDLAPPGRGAKTSQISYLATALQSLLEGD